MISLLAQGGPDQVRQDFYQLVVVTRARVGSVIRHPVCPCALRYLFLGIEQAFQGGIAYIQLSGSSTSRDIARQETLQNSSKTMIEAPSVCDSGTANSAALLSGPVHSGPAQSEWEVIVPSRERSWWVLRRKRNSVDHVDVAVALSQDRVETWRESYSSLSHMSAARTEGVAEAYRDLNEVTRAWRSS